MNDFEFDLKLKARAKREAPPIPGSYEGRLLATLDKLPQAERVRPRSRILYSALAAAVLAAVLLVPVCAAAWKGWLEPVVDYGGNGDLIERYTVAVNETWKGNRCDVTLENAVTDGTAVYLLFNARYDPEFDLDFALEWGGLTLYPSGAGGVYRRIDDSSQPGTARFIGMVNSAGRGDSAGNLLGQEVKVWVAFHEPASREAPDGGTIRYLQRSEGYYFDHVSLNDSIDRREMEWEDGTRLTISPLTAVSEFTRMWEENEPGEDYTDELDKLNVTLEFADGTRMEYADQGITVKNQGALIDLGWSSVISGEPGAETGFILSRQFPQLVDPEAVTALIIGGVRYETADAVN